MGSTARRILQEVKEELAGRRMFEKSVLHSKKAQTTKQKTVTKISKEVEKPNYDSRSQAHFDQFQALRDKWKAGSQKDEMTTENEYEKYKLKSNRRQMSPRIKQSKIAFQVAACDSFKLHKFKEIQEYEREFSTAADMKPAQGSALSQYSDSPGK